MSPPSPHYDTVLKCPHSEHPGELAMATQGRSSLPAHVFLNSLRPDNHIIAPQQVMSLGELV